MNRFSIVKKVMGMGLLAALFCVSAPKAQAQDGELRTRFGIKGGLNLSNLYIDNVNDEKTKIGFNAGIFAKAPINEVFAIQPELLYTTAGTKIAGYQNIPFTPNGNINFNLQYLQLPVLAVATLSAVNIQFGPYVSYLLGANVKNVQVDNNGIPTSSGSGTTLNRDNFNALDYGLAAGIAFDFSGFQIGARYNFGLREVGKGGLSGELTNNAKNSVANIYIGYGF